MSTCPSDYQLECHLRDGAPWLEPHLSSCDRCRARLADMREQGEEFLREVFPATVAALTDRVAPARGGRWRVWGVWLAPVPALAAAAALLLVAPRAPPDGYVGAKGSALGLTVFARTATGARALADGDAVPSGSALRFQVRAATPCHLWIVSVDGAGRISRLYPATGEGGAWIREAGPLPGGAVLDDEAGPERIYGVCTSRPLPFAEVARAAAGVAGGGATAVRRGGALGAAAEGALQATVLVEKRP